MRVIMNVRLPHQPFNAALKDGTAGSKLNRILEAIKDTRRANDDIVINAIREMANASNDSTGAILMALGGREKEMIAAINGLARGIRDDLATLRAPPPVGGTGSQVRDGGASP